MNSSHWMMRAGPEALAGVGNRAAVIETNALSGSGAECDYCHRPIDPQAIEHQVTVRRFTELRTLRFHRLCHHMWETI
jgi:hypothetical protein